MTKSQRIKILKAHEWKEEEGRISLHVLDHFKTVHLQTRNGFFVDLFTVSVFVTTENYGFEWISFDESKKALDWAFANYKNGNYFSKENKAFGKVSRKITKISLDVLNQGISHLSNKQLSNLLQKINVLGNEMYSYSMLPEGVDTLTKKDYQKLLINITDKDFFEIVTLLTTSEEMSFVEKQQFDLLKLTTEASKNKNIIKNPEFIKKIKNHSKKYFWIQNNFSEAIFLDEEYFLNQIAQLLKKYSPKDIRKEFSQLKNKSMRIRKEIAQVCEKYKLSDKTALFFKLIRYFSILQDIRKENLQKMVFCFDRILEETGKRFNIKKSVLNNGYFISDIDNLLLRNKRLEQEELNKREKIFCISYIESNKIKTDWLFGKQTEEVIQFFKQKREKLANRRLQGLVASSGMKDKMIQGKVKIVFNPAKDIFQKDEILVTGMTRPEFVPLMKKAKAIITNEGGITSHAAIVSRELKVPCIIGTKVATDVLKDGEIVEVDLEKGIIKVLK